MMTLDEAIKHAEWVAKQNSDLAEHLYHTDEEAKCRECAEAHVQLAEWLKELKSLREQKRPHGEWKYEPTKGAFCSECGWHSIWGYNFCPNCGASMVGVVLMEVDDE